MKTRDQLVLAVLFIMTAISFGVTALLAVTSPNPNLDQVQRLMFACGSLISTMAMGAWIGRKL